MHVLHIITGLGVGGTPVALKNILCELKGDGATHSVVSLIEMGVIGEELRAMGVPVTTLNMRRGAPDFRALWRLVRLIRRERPDLVQTWLYHADLLGGIAARLAGRAPIVWNIRHATLSAEHDSKSTLWAARLGAWLSRRVPKAVVVNTQCGRDLHVEFGYDPRRMRVLPNGFDTTRFHPSSTARSEIRQELRVSAEAPLIGLVSRFERLKGHRVFIEAMAEVGRQDSECQFVLCGAGVDASNADLTAMLNATGLRARFHLLGQRRDVPRIQAALDIAVNASFSEAFSNSIGEAMASGVPCVVTDVGDSAFVVADTGFAVPSNDPQALGQACLEVLRMPSSRRASLGRRARRRIVEHFDIKQIAGSYQRLWQELAGPKSVERPLAEAA